MYCIMEAMADKAWFKLLKEKMMKLWEKKIGHDMDQSAEFFVEASMMKWMDFEGYMKKKPEMMKQFMKKMEEKMKKK